MENIKYMDHMKFLEILQTNLDGNYATIDPGRITPIKMMHINGTKFEISNSKILNDTKRLFYQKTINNKKYI